MDEVYQHLRKKGLVPEKQQQEIRVAVKYPEFQVQEHRIGTIASNTLWKVQYTHVVLISFIVCVNI